MQKFFIISVFLFLIDRILKYISILYIPTEKLLELGSFFEFNFIFFQNPYIAFGIPIPLVITFIVTGVLIWAALFFLYKTFINKDFFEFCTLLFVFLGSISNFFDRVYYFFVIDYFEITFFGQLLPVFNIADLMICIPLFFYIYKKW